MNGFVGLIHINRLVVKGISQFIDSNDAHIIAQEANPLISRFKIKFINSCCTACSARLIFIDKQQHMTTCIAARDTCSNV